MSLALRAVIALALSVMSPACTHVETARPPRVVILALDAGTWDLLDGYMERRLLPNLRRLRDQGAHGTLASIQPSSSPVVWTTVATGKNPAKHGITWFVRFPDGPGKPAPVHRGMRKTKALWNILGEEGFDVAFVGWFVTWPAEPVAGRMITDRAHWGEVQQEAFPDYYLATLSEVSQGEAVAVVPEFMDIDYDPERSDGDDGHIPPLIYDGFLKAYKRDLFYVRATKAVLEDGPLPEVLGVYLRGTDDVQHAFWKFMDPEPFGNVSEDQVRALGKVIEKYWQWIDARVGEILSHYDDNTLVLVISDHGAGPAVGEHAIVVPEHLHLSGAHRDNGIIIAHGPGIRRDVRIEGASVYDIAPTLLHYLDLPVADDMDGRVLLDLFDAEIAGRKVARLATYEGERHEVTKEVVEDAEVDEKILEHLRSLGYID